jgi:hypothetical protein
MKYLESWCLPHPSPVNFLTPPKPFPRRSLPNGGTKDSYLSCVSKSSRKKCFFKKPNIILPCAHSTLFQKISSKNTRDS